MLYFTILPIFGRISTKFSTAVEVTDEITYDKSFSGSLKGCLVGRRRKWAILIDRHSRF